MKNFPSQNNTSYFRLSLKKAAKYKNEFQFTSHKNKEKDRTNTDFGFANFVKILKTDQLKGS